MADQNIVVRVLNKVKKAKKRIFSVIILVVVGFVICIGPIFWGTIKEVFKNAGEIFADVLDNVNISGNELEIDQEYLSNAKKRLKTMGIEPESLGLGGHEEYLEKFLEAEIVTNYPHLGEDGLQGTVYFERAKPDGSITQLEYKEYNKFYAMLNNSDSEIYKYFTVDTADWTVHVGKNESNGDFEVEKINYKNMVSKFSMPFEFPISLAMVTQNPQFALALVNLVKNSKMVVTIAESVTVTTVDTVHSYHEKITKINTGTNIPEVVSEGTHSSQDENVEVTNSTQVLLSRANTWIVNYVTELTHSDTTTVGDPQTTDYDDTTDSSVDSGVITQIYNTNIKDTVTVTTHFSGWRRRKNKNNRKNR